MHNLESDTTLELVWFDANYMKSKKNRTRVSGMSSCDDSMHHGNPGNNIEPLTWPRQGNDRDVFVLGRDAAEAVTRGVYG